MLLLFGGAQVVVVVTSRTGVLTSGLHASTVTSGIHAGTVHSGDHEATIEEQ